jgi:Tol biopolymer transport system component
MVPPGFDRLVRTCLAKNPEDRWQSAADLGRQLRFLGQTDPGGSTAPATAGRRPGVLLGATAVFFLAVTSGVLFWLWRQAASIERPVMRLSLMMPEGMNLVGTLALAPDGDRVALVAADAGGTSRLWIRPMDSSVATPLAGTEGARFPFWSPDGTALGFYSDGKLRRVSLSNREVQSLADITDFRGGSWGRNGDILFSPNANDGLYRVADTGGAVTRVTTLDLASDESHRWPCFLPDGRRFIFLRVGQPSGLSLASLDGRDSRLLVPGVLSAPRFAPPQTLLYVSGRTILAQPFDLRSAAPIDDPLPVAEGVWRDPTVWGATSFSVSTNGLLAFRHGSGSEMQLTWFDRSGKNLGPCGAAGTFSEPVLAPDAKRAAVGHLNPLTGRQDIWIHDLVRGSATLFASGREDTGGQTPVWSPDGSTLVYTIAGGDGNSLIEQRIDSADGGGKALFTEPRGVQVYADDWSADGRYLVYERVDPKTRYDLWAFDMKTRKAQAILATESNEVHSSVSPDGRFLAYVSDESGRGEVYVRTFPVPGEKWSISSGGGDQPRWREDGRELFFVGPGRALMSVDIAPSASGLEASVPRKLFSTNLPEATVSGVRNTYLVVDRGQRFLVTLNLEESSGVQVILNWPEALGRQ